MEADVSSFYSCREAILVLWENIHGENHSHNYHTKLATPTVVKSNIISSHIRTTDQTTGIKHSSDTQTIGNASSEQGIRAIACQGYNETTVKILNVKCIIM